MNTETTTKWFTCREGRGTKVHIAVKHSDDRGPLPFCTECRNINAYHSFRPAASREEAKSLATCKKCNPVAK